MRNINILALGRFRIGRGPGTFTRSDVRPQAALAALCCLMVAGCHTAKLPIAASNGMAPISPDEAEDEAMADRRIVNEALRSGSPR